jgi:diketogulonate reductase-like aldo/keto reductase
MTAAMTRRRLLEVGAGAVLGAAAATWMAPPGHAAPDAARRPGDRDSDVIRRKVRSSGVEVPAIGIGSWQTFDVDGAGIPAVQPVLARFLALGGRVVDSSPMYGKAEAAIGTMLKGIRAADAAAPSPFLATKVWTQGAARGEAEMTRSMTRLGVASLDLMQIHNLVDWKVHLRTLRAWKASGTFRHIGVTHYAHSAFDDLEAVVRREKLDFVQLPYSVTDRLAEKRLLPAAADAGVAVLVMQPFDSGALFERVKGRALPGWAAEIDCTSWAQVFLKFLLGHPAVTCPIPATSKVKHLEDNMGALRGRVPDAALRARIVRELESR